MNNRNNIIENRESIRKIENKRSWSNRSNTYEAQQEKYSRECNMVVYNMSEHESDDIDTRVEHDNYQIRGVLDELYLENISFVKTSRIGKRRANWDEQPRPLMVRFKNPRDKWNVIGQGKFLKETESYFDIYFALDMEKEEMERNNKLRNEMMERRNRGENVIIKNGQIVNKRKSGYWVMNSRNQTYQSFQSGNNRR